MISRLLALLAGLVLAAAAVADTASERLALPADVVFGRGEYEIALKSGILQRILGKEHYDWDVDLDAGIIRFTSRSKVVTAPVQVIGTYNTLDGTFLWGWDHPSVPEARGADARLARRFGQRNKLPLFTTRKVKCTEEQAWQFTSVALYLSGAQGSFRGQSGTTSVFMTFGTIGITPNK